MVSRSCSKCRLEFIEAIEAAARSRALHGTTSVARWQGNIVYQLNPDWLDEGMRDLLGLTDANKFLRVNGKLVPEMITVAPSTDLVLGVLAAHARKQYGRNVKMEIDNKFSGGVQIIGNKPAPQISAPLPMIQIVQDAIAERERAPADEAEPADFTELDEWDQDEATVTDTGPEPVDESDDAEPAQTTAPAPVMIRTATPPELAPAGNPLITPRNGRPLSDLERDLLSKIPSSLNRKA